MDADTVVIKKYANRRLYDTSNSCYINLEDIAALVRNGKDLRWWMPSSGEDITRVTLTQIIVEDAKGQPAGLPLELLRQLIVASDRAGQEFIMWYLKSAFDAYQNVQSSLQTRFSELQSAALSPIQAVKSFLGSPGAEKTRRPKNCWSCVGDSRSWKRNKRSPSPRERRLKRRLGQERTANVTRRLHDDR